jgi:hypothetical protein
MPIADDPITAQGLTWMNMLAQAVYLMPALQRAFHIDRYLPRPAQPRRGFSFQAPPTAVSIRFRTSAMRVSSPTPAYSSETFYDVADAWVASYGSSVAAEILANPRLRDRCAPA